MPYSSCRASKDVMNKTAFYKTIASNISQNGTIKSNPPTALLVKSSVSIECFIFLLMHRNKFDFSSKASIDFNKGSTANCKRRDTLITSVCSNRI